MKTADTAGAGAIPLPAWRLHALRAAYLLVVVGLGFQVWPGLVTPHPNWELMHGVVQSMLAAFSLLALGGVWRPLPMLPILLWEIVWKSLWLALVFAPRWAAGQIDASTSATASACTLAVVFPLVIPWRYVAAKVSVGSPADRGAVR